MLEDGRSVTPVLVSNVAEAVRFYERAFGLHMHPHANPPPGAVDLALPQSDYFIFRVQDERAPVSSPDVTYTKGRTPRFQLRVNNVNAAVEQAVNAGGIVRTRLFGKHDTLPVSVAHTECMYAHIADPFGHIWAFALPSREAH